MACRLLPMSMLLLVGCDGRPPSDEELMQRALNAASAEERERAAVTLAGRGPAALAATPADRRADFLDASPAVARLRKLLGDAEPRVQAAAASGLAGLRDIDSLPRLLDLMNSPHAVVRLRSDAAVSSLLDVGFSFDAMSPDANAERAQAVAGYRWYFDTQLGPKAHHREVFRGFLGPEQRPIEGPLPDPDERQVKQR